MLIGIANSACAKLCIHGHLLPKFLKSHRNSVIGRRLGGKRRLWMTLHHAHGRVDHDHLAALIDN